MVAVRSNKEMELTPALTPIAPYKSFRDGLRPPLTAAARQRPRKIRSGRGDGRRQIEQGDGIDSSLDTNRPIQVTDRAMEAWYYCMNDPQSEGQMASCIQRRKFLATLLGGAAAWPLAARAQQAGKVPTIGFLGSGTPITAGAWVVAFAQRLRELGWIEDRTIKIDLRWAEG